MSVMIKSMNVVPKSCNKCNLRSEYDKCNAHEYGEDDPDVILYCISETKPDWCPLIEIPDNNVGNIGKAFAKAHECCGGVCE